MYAYLVAAYNGVNILEMDGIKGEVVGTLKAGPLAARIATLLNRHGLEDCDTSTLADAILDLEQRRG